MDPGQLRKTIKNGVENGVWVYYDATAGIGYDQVSPPIPWQISDNAILYTPDEAARLKLPIKGKEGATPPQETCPVCGNPVDQCTCGVPTPTTKAKLQGQGAVNQAFQQVMDLCQDQKVNQVGRLVLAVEGSGKQAAADLRVLGLAVPQFGKGRFTLSARVIGSFGQGPNAEFLTLDFRGGWDRYKRLRNIAETFAQEADELKVSVRLTADFDEGLDVEGAQITTIRDVLAALEMGKVTLEAFAV
jgi:hypothetical protein